MWKKLFGAATNSNVQANEDQSVHRAARQGMEELVVLLDSDPSLRDQPGWFGRQPLHVAAEAGRFDCVDLLLNRSASPNAREKLHHQAPLHHAVAADSLECVDRLLQAGADVNAADDRGETPIFYAKSRRVVEKLETAGADLLVISGRGQYPFQYCAAYIRSVDVMKFWVTRTIPINHVPEFAWPALGAICGIPYGPQESPDYERDIQIMHMLLSHGADVDLPDKSGDRALVGCCVNGHFPLAEFLLKARANPNLTNRAGDSALHAAVFRGNEQLVRLLLDHGADVNLPNRHHHTPYDLSAAESPIRSVLAPLHHASPIPVPTPDEVIHRLRAIPRFRLARFQGCSQAEVARLESHFAIQLPAAYREFLKRMGNGAGEFLSSDHWRFKFADLFELARSDEYEELCELPENYFVFAERAGCAWVFFVADGKSDDPPVFLFVDGAERTVRQIARSVWEFIESLVTDYEIWSDTG